MANQDEDIFGNVGDYFAELLKAEQDPDAQIEPSAQFPYLPTITKPGSFPVSTAPPAVDPFPPKKKKDEPWWKGTAADLGLGRRNIDTKVQRRDGLDGNYDALSVIRAGINYMADSYYDDTPVPSATAFLLKGTRAALAKEAEQARKRGEPPPPKIDAEALVLGGSQRAEARDFERRINRFRPPEDQIKVGDYVDTGSGKKFVPATSMEAYRAGIKVAPPVIKTEPPVDEDGFPLLDDDGEIIPGGEELVSRRIKQRMRDAARPEPKGLYGAFVPTKPIAVPGGLPQEDLDVLPGMRTAGEEVTPEQIEESLAKGEDPGFIGLMDEEVEVPFMENPRMDSLTIQANPFIAALSFLNETAANVRSKPTRQFTRQGLDIVPGVSTDGGAASFAIGLGRKSADAFQGTTMANLALGILDRVANPGKILDEDIKLYQMGDRYRDQEPITGKITKYDDSFLGQMDRFSDASYRGLKHAGRDLAAVFLGLPLLVREVYKGIASGRSLEETVDRGADVTRFMGTEIARAFVEPANAVEDGTVMWFSTVAIPFAKRIHKAKRRTADEISGIREKIHQNAKDLADESEKAAATQNTTAQTKQYEQVVDNAVARHNELVNELKTARREYLKFATLDGLQFILGNSPLSMYDMSVSLLKYLSNLKTASPTGVNLRWALESKTERLPQEFMDWMRERIDKTNQAELALYDDLGSLPYKERPAAIVHMYMEHQNSAQVKMPDGTRIYDVLDFSPDRRGNVDKYTSLIYYDRPQGGMPGQYRLTPAGKKAYAKSPENAKHLDNQLDLANRYSRPLIDTINEYSQRGKEHGLITDAALDVWFPQVYEEGKRQARKARGRANLSRTVLDEGVELGYAGDLSSLQRNTRRQAAIEWRKQNPNAKPEDNPFSIDKSIDDYAMVTDLHAIVGGRVNGLINLIHEAELCKQIAESDYGLTGAQMKAMNAQVERFRKESGEAAAAGNKARASELDKQASMLNELLSTYVPAPETKMRKTGVEGGVPDYFYLNGILETDQFGNKKWRPRTGDEKLFIQGDIMLELANIRQFKEQMTGKVGTTYNRLKEAFTVGSPQTHKRNAIGAWVYQAQLAGISPFNPKNLKYWAKALVDMARSGLKNKSEQFKRVYGRGALDGTRISELRVQSMLLEPFQGALGSVQAFNRKWHDFAHRYPETFDRAVKMGMSAPLMAGKAAVDTFRSVYSATDNWMRLAKAYKIDDMLQKAGKTDAKTYRNAMADVRYLTIDYNNIPGYAEVMRAPVLPHLLKSSRSQTVGGSLTQAKPSFVISTAFVNKPYIVYPIQAMHLDARMRGNHPVRVAMYQHFLDYLNRKNQLEAGISSEVSDAVMMGLPGDMQNAALPMAVFGSEYATAQPPEAEPAPPIDTPEYSEWLKRQRLRTHTTRSGKVDPVIEFARSTTHIPHGPFVPALGRSVDKNEFGQAMDFIKRNWRGTVFVLQDIAEIIANRDDFRGRQVYRDDQVAPNVNTAIEVANKLVKDLGFSFIPELEGIPGMSDLLGFLYERETRPEGEYGREEEGFQRLPGVNSPRLGGGREVNRDLMAERGTVTREGDVLTPEQREKEVDTATRIVGRTGRQALMSLLGQVGQQIGGTRQATARIMGVPREAISKTAGDRLSIQEADVQQVIQAHTLMKDFIPKLQTFAGARAKDGTMMYPEAARVLRAAKRFDAEYKRQLKGTDRRKKGLQFMDQEEQKKALRRSYRLLDEMMKTMSRSRRKYGDYRKKRIREAIKQRRKAETVPDFFTESQELILDALFNREPENQSE